MAATETAPAGTDGVPVTSSSEPEIVMQWKSKKNVHGLRSKLVQYQQGHSAEDAGWAWPEWAAAKSWPGRDLGRFLVARQGDIDKALRMLTRHVQWRVQDCAYFPSGLPPVQPVMSALETGKVCVAGRSKAGFPIAWVRAQHHIVADTTPEQSEELVTFVIEQLVRASCVQPTPEELPDRALANQDLPGKFMAVVDMAEYGYANLDTGIVKALLTVLSRNFPERMQKIYILNEGWVFWMLWKMIEGLLDDRVKSKIVFLGAEFKEALLDVIPAHMLPKEYGGQHATPFDLSSWAAQYAAASEAATKHGANTSLTLPLDRQLQPAEEMVAMEEK